jgi:hypothetical protein
MSEILPFMNPTLLLSYLQQPATESSPEPVMSRLRRSNLFL